MTARVVLDASASIHLVLNGPHASLLAAKLADATVVTAPELFCSESGNSLWKYVRSGELSLDLAIARFEECMALVDSFVSDRMLMPEALIEATQRQSSVYDMLYAILARRIGAMVLTMDKGFASKLRDLDLDGYCPLLALDR